MSPPAKKLSVTTPVIVLVGPTAIGKTALSLDLASRYNCEIISMDSMQVYRFMDIGTAKVSREEQTAVRHHLIDIRNPDEQYDAACFVQDGLRAIQKIAAHGKIPLLTGGTGMYLSSLLNGIFEHITVSSEIRDELKDRLIKEGRSALHHELLQVDPETGVRIHANDTQRLLRGLEIYRATGIPWSQHLKNQGHAAQAPALTNLLLLGLHCDRDTLHDRIKKRTLQMMTELFEAEVKGLINQGYTLDIPSMQSIGYRHMGKYITGEWDLETATNLLIRDTRRYAKRQFTWFRRYPEMDWYEKISRISDAMLNKIDAFLYKPSC